jgi:hypothetical protein
MKTISEVTLRGIHPMKSNTNLKSTLELVIREKVHQIQTKHNRAMQT